VLTGVSENAILFASGLTRPGLEPIIYNTRGEHDDHYTNDVVNRLIKVHSSFLYFKLSYLSFVFYLNLLLLLHLINYHNRNLFGRLPIITNATTMVGENILE
jgi:hypothetical protein